MEPRTDRFGPALRALALAAAVFALVAIIAPRLGITGSAKSSTPASAPSPVATPARLDQVPEDPSAVGGTEVTTTTMPEATTTTMPEATTTTMPEATTTTMPEVTTTTMPEVTTTTVPPDGAAIELSIEMITGATDKESSMLAEGDPITWRLIIANVGDEHLWGAYAFLELHGPAWCEEHQLAPGAATSCWIDTIAVEGQHQAEAWATAWTQNRMVETDLRHDFVVIR